MGKTHTHTQKQYSPNVGKKKTIITQEKKNEFVGGVQWVIIMDPHFKYKNQTSISKHYYF